jgi:hypothetical protein
MKLLGRRRKKRRREDRKERRAFAWIVCMTALPVLLTTGAIVSSSRPDLYNTVPAITEDGPPPLAWRTLDDLLGASGGPMESRPDLFRREVQMVGYLFTFGSSQERESTARFLLVPDAGNWLNPPHFHPDEVVDVRVKAGMTISLLDRKAVVVRGMLSVESADLKIGRVVYHLLASDVRVYRD